MANYLYVAGPGSTQFVGTTRYYPLAGTGDVTTEANVQVRIRDSYTWSRLGVNVSANSVTATSTLKSRINGADGNQAVSIPSSSTGFFEDTSNSDSLADGDLVAIALVPGGTGSSILTNTVSSLLTHAAGVAVQVAASVTNGWQANGATRWTPIHGPLVASTSEVRTQVTCRNATDLSRLRVYVSANAASGSSSVKTRINGADGAQSVSIGAGATGEFEDTSNTDSVSVGDEVGLQLTGGGTGTITVTVAQCESSVGLMASANLSGLTFTGTALYRAIGTLNTTGAEADMAVPARTTSLGLNSLFFSTDSNTRSVSTSVALRRNGSSVMSVSVPANTTGFFEDTSSVISPSASSDTFNFSISSAAGSGTLTLRNLSITQLAFATVTIAGATAAATAAAAAGSVAHARTVPGETATAAAAAAAGVVASVRIVAVAGEKAAATAAAGAGAVQTFPAAIIVGVGAAATAAANAGAVSALQVVAVAGAKATATAAAGAGAVLVARTVPGETAAAVAVALAAELLAQQRERLHPVMPAPGARIGRHLPAAAVRARRPGDV